MSSSNQEVTTIMTKSAEKARKGGQPAMHTPPVVSPQDWEAAREQLLVKEKAQMRARDAVLHGIDRRSPSSIVTLLPDLTGLAYEIRDDTIVVSEP